MSSFSRREFVLSVAAVPGAATAGTAMQPGLSKETRMNAAAFAHHHAPVPLPFNPKHLRGLSERLVASHWENNYGGAVKALNSVRGRLQQALHDEKTPPYVYNGLKREQLIRTGSVVLHELYFANLGGNGTADSHLRSRLSSAFGSFDAWQTEFRKIGEGLGGGSGWVVLGLNRKLGILENYWMADYSTYPAHTEPVLVMDMYEHSYHMDYGAAAAKYIDAFFANINWDTVAARLDSKVLS